MAPGTTVGVLASDATKTAISKKIDFIFGVEGFGGNLTNFEG
jgi:hypothetical protein